MQRGFSLGGPGVLPELPNLGVEFGVGRFVERVAGFDALEIDAAVGAVENQEIVLDFPDPGTLFQIPVFASIKDHPVARRNRNPGLVG